VRSPLVGVVVEAADLRVRVSGFGVRVRGSPCPADLDGGRWGEPEDPRRWWFGGRRR
jgi:hypothetical protein